MNWHIILVQFVCDKTDLPAVGRTHPWGADWAGVWQRFTGGESPAPARDSALPAAIWSDWQQPAGAPDGCAVRLDLRLGGTFRARYPVERRRRSSPGVDRRDEHRQNAAVHFARDRHYGGHG